MKANSKGCSDVCAPKALAVPCASHKGWESALSLFTCNDPLKLTSPLMSTADPEATGKAERPH